MALTTADSSEDEKEGFNQEIPQLNLATYDTLMTAIHRASIGLSNYDCNMIWGFVCQSQYKGPQDQLHIS